MGVSMSEPLASGGVREASTEAADNHQDEEEIEHRGFLWFDDGSAHMSGRLPIPRTTQLSCREPQDK